MSCLEQAKFRAAEKAVEHVKSGSVLGLGSGSTASHAINIIGDRLKTGKLQNVIGVPTSLQSMAEAIKAGIPLTTLDEQSKIDLAIDGADQIDGELNAIKGGGGALLREKIVASASKEFIIIADETKLTSSLGSGCHLPIEVLPFALKPVLRRIEALGAEVLIRTGNGKLGPTITDNGNLIVDADFGYMQYPETLEERLKNIPGVIETGLFLGYAHLAYIGTKDSVKKIEKSSI